MVVLYFFWVKVNVSSSEGKNRESERETDGRLSLFGFYLT